MIIIDGKTIAHKIRARIAKEVRQLKKPPVLAVVIVGDDPASALYVRIKEKVALNVGIKCIKFELPKNTNEERITQLIKKINIDQEINGVIIQLPLPNALDTEKIIAKINPEKDVDNLTEKSIFPSPTVEGIMQIFNYYKISLQNKTIVIIGHGKLVGRPLENKLLGLNLKPIVCTNKTKNLSDITQKADILISATGSPKLINNTMIQNGSVVIDAGTSVEKQKNTPKCSKTVGDVDFESVKNKVSYITPTIGGVGPITVSMLLSNVLLSAKRRSK